jgi:PST family polysaccharide transporter
MKIKLMISRLKGNAFINASFFSAMSSFTKIITSLVLGKIIAVKLGAEGMALFGQLLSFVTIVLVIAGGSINQGVIKYVAEFMVTDEDKLKNLMSTSFRIIVYSCCLVGLLSIFGSKYFANSILHDKNFYTIFILFGFTLIFYGLNNLFLSIVNGFKEYKKNNIINIVINIAGLILSLFFIYSLDVYGALLSVVANQSVTFFITLYLLRNEQWMKKDFLLRKVDIDLLKKLSGFALLAVASSALTPFVSILVRNYIIDSISLEAAGLYEFVNRVSGASIMFFTLTISTYYLPRISEIQKKEELIKEVKSTCEIIVPVLLVILTSVYLLRLTIIKFLASDNFLPSADLFLYYLLGIFFKIISQILSFIFVAKAKIKIALSLEVSFNFYFSIMTIYSIDVFGLMGTAYAYLLSYILYFGILVYLFYQLLKKYYDT